MEKSSVGTVQNSMRSNHQIYKYGIESYQLHNPLITVNVLSDDLRREAFDEAISLLLDSVNNFPTPGVAYIYLNLVRLPHITPYARQQAQVMVQKFDSDRDIYIALLFKSTVVRFLIGGFLTQISRFLSARTEIKMFGKEEDAMQWLTTKQTSR